MGKPCEMANEVSTVVLKILSHINHTDWPESLAEHYQEKKTSCKLKFLCGKPNREKVSVAGVKE